MKTLMEMTHVAIPMELGNKLRQASEKTGLTEESIVVQALDYWMRLRVPKL